METNSTDPGFFARLRAGMAGARRGFVEAKLSRADADVEVASSEEDESDQIMTATLMGWPGGLRSSPLFGKWSPGSDD